MQDTPRRSGSCVTFGFALCFPLLRSSVWPSWLHATWEMHPQLNAAPAAPSQWPVVLRTSLVARGDDELLGLRPVSVSGDVESDKLPGADLAPSAFGDVSSTVLQRLTMEDTACFSRVPFLFDVVNDGRREPGKRSLFLCWWHSSESLRRHFDAVQQYTTGREDWVQNGGAAQRSCLFTFHLWSVSWPFIKNHQPWMECCQFIIIRQYLPSFLQSSSTRSTSHMRWSLNYFWHWICASSNSVLITNYPRTLPWHKQASIRNRKSESKSETKRKNQRKIEIKEQRESRTRTEKGKTNEQRARRDEQRRKNKHNNWSVTRGTGEAGWTTRMWIRWRE